MLAALQPSLPASLAPERPRVLSGPVSATVTSVRDLPASLSAEWDDLATSAAEPNAFAERWFVMAGACHLAGGNDVRMIEVRQGDGLIALLPVNVELHDRLPLKHVTNWLHSNAFLGTPLLRAGHERAAWEAILGLLDGADWAPGWLHLNGLSEGGPVHVALLDTRRADTVHRTERALLQSTLSPASYYETTVRKKKRKELKRLQSRLAELGTVTVRRLDNPGELWPWCDAFLALERSGWKGRAGSALASATGTDGFFRAALAGAWEAGRLEIVRMDLDDRPIAMLVNFLTAPGSFSFKIAFDEEYARYSPGVLIQLDNYAVLDRPDIDWMDSCASENHPMINSLWAERRAVVRVSVSLAGLWRQAQFHAVRTAERASAAVKRHPSPSSSPIEADDD